MLQKRVIIPMHETLVSYYCELSQAYAKGGLFYRPDSQMLSVVSTDGQAPDWCLYSPNLTVGE